MTKRDSDFNKGKFSRESTAIHLNSYIEEHGLIFERNHDYLKTMHVSEKVKHNNLKDGILPAPFEKAMYLHYVLTNKNTLNRIPFIFMYKSSGGFYLKVVKEYKESPKDYLKLLIQFNYHVLVVDEQKNKYSSPIPFNTIATHWHCAMATSKGNRNRLQFYGSVKSVYCRDILQETLLEPNIIQMLINLF